CARVKYSDCNGISCHGVGLDSW
nr:immunoglobulin heavy chain junction region [Macaca mulatta]